LKTLIAISGGLDSTLLLKILADAGHQVVAFYMDLSKVKCEGSPDPDFYSKVVPFELDAARNVVNWFAGRGTPITMLDPYPIKYTPPPEDYPTSGNSRSWRVFPMLQAAAHLAQLYKCEKFVYGKTLENQRSADWEVREIWNRKWWAENAIGVEYETPLIDLRIGKPHAIYELPSGLIEHCLSCDTPKFGKPCGECTKCEMVKTTRDLLHQGCQPGMIFDYLLRLRNAGPYIGNRVGEMKYGARSHPAPFPAYTRD